MGTVHIDSTLKVSDSLNVTGNTKLGQDLKVEGNLYLTNLPSIQTATGLLEPLYKSGDGTVYKGPIVVTASAAASIPCISNPDGSVPNSPIWYSNFSTASLYTGYCSGSKVGIGTELPRVSFDNLGTSYSAKLALGLADPVGIAEYFTLKTPVSVTLQNVMNVQNAAQTLFSLNGQGLLHTQKLALGVSPANALGVFHLKTTNLLSSNNDPIFIIENNARKLLQINNQGLMRARQIKVNLDVAWPDYVFDKNYVLMPLTELEKYFTKNKHLPNIPNAKEVEKDGIDLGEMNRVLLEKVEELTIYLIQQEKVMQALNKRLELLEKGNN